MTTLRGHVGEVGGRDVLSIALHDGVPTEDWFRQCLIMLEAQGYRCTPVRKDGTANLYAKCQHYPKLSQYGDAKQIGVCLDSAILLDYDGNKAKGDIIPLEALAPTLGLDDMPMPVQENAAGDSLHWLFKLPPDCPELKSSADGFLPHIDLKTGNQLMHLKPSKIINDGALPTYDELPVAPAVLIDVLRKESKPSLRAVWNGSAAELEEAKEILSHIKGSHSYSEWLNVLMGIHSKFGDSVEGIDLADEWSKSIPGYASRKLVEYKLSTFTADGGRTWGTVCHHAREQGADLSGIARSYKASGPPPVAQALLQGQPTQDSVALAFAQSAVGDWLYAHGGGGWLRWTGSHWAPDTIETIRNEVRDLARWSNPEGKAAPASASFQDGVLKLLTADPAFARDYGDFDTDSSLLCTPAGVYDLSTMTRLEHSRDLLITQCTQVNPEPGRPERFLRFLSEISAGDDELVHFHRLSLGACLSGAPDNHWLLYWYGPTARNGKNTLADLIVWILGDYASTFPTESLMASKQSHPTDLLPVRGKRLVISSEVPDGSRWNEARLKQLVSDETLAARPLYSSRTLNFTRSHKHLIFGNFRPALNAMDPGLTSKLKLVPFNVSFLGREDLSLQSTLRAEAPMILHNLMEAHRQWVDNGRRLPACKVVDEATADYFSAQATVEMWLTECCRVFDNADWPAKDLPRASDLYDNYRNWKRSRGESPMTQQRWGEYMGQCFEKKNREGIRYVGVDLTNEARHSDFCPF